MYKDENPRSKTNITRLSTNWKEEWNRIFRIAKAIKTYSILTSNGAEGHYYESHFKCRALELNRRALEFCFNIFEAQSSGNTKVFFFFAKKSYVPQTSFCFVACEPFWPQFRCRNSTSKTKFFDTLQPTPFLITLNGSSVGPLSGELGLEGPNNRRQKIGARINSRELYQDAILMTS